MAQSEVQIPRDYGSWKLMITQQCGENLTDAFLKARLQVLKDTNDAYTQRFIELYGEDYYQTLVGWFERAGKDIV